MYENTTHDSVAPEDARTHRPFRRRRRAGSLFAWLMVLLVLLAIAGTTAMLGLLLGERSYAGRIYPHISVRGFDLSAYGPVSARAALEERYSAFLRQPVELSLGTTIWHPSAAELGLRIDFDRALNEALAAGREQTRLENARTVGAIWQQGIDVPLHLRVDETALQRYLQTITGHVEAAPRDADLHIVGTTVVLTPEQGGVQVLVDDTLRDIVAAAQSLAPQQVALRTRSLAAQRRASDLAPTATEARTLLNGPVVLTAGTQRWVWTPAQIAGWLSLRDAAVAGRPTMSLSLDQEPLRRSLVAIAAAVHVRGDPPRVDWNNGQLRVLTPGSADHGMDAALTLARVNTALRSSQRTVAVPMIALPPSLDDTNLASLGITTQLASGVSSFRASQDYRITNIRAGARQMHGILIPPGATFSFNNNLGEVDAAHGFVEGSAIVDNRTQKEWGGGLCQVSTTMFRAAFFAGLPIDERHEHAFRISWYEELGEPPGLDAAIYTGYDDLRFTNDTGNWMLIQSYVDLQQQRLTIALYGAPTGRSVSMSHSILSTTPAPTKAVYTDDPTLPRGTVKRTDWSRPGMKVEVYRTVQRGDTVLSNTTFDTDFQPWPNIYARGTGGGR